MILDRENHVAAALAIAGTSNLLATDVIDLGIARDIGSGTDLYWYHQLGTAAPAGGTGIEFQLITSDDPAFGSGVTVIDTTGNILLANLPINTLIFRNFPRSVGIGAKLNRYVTARLVRSGTFTGAATWSSGVTYDITDFRQFYNAPNYNA